MTTTKDPINEALDGLRAAVRDLDRAVADKLRTAEAIEAPPELRDLLETAMAYAEAQRAYSDAYGRWSRERPEEVNQSIDAPGWKEIAEAPCRAASRARERMCTVAEKLWTAKREAAASQRTDDALHARAAGNGNGEAAQ